jgi:hypothetical protein
VPSGDGVPPGGTPGGPLVGWEAPEEEAGYGIGESITNGWRIARSQLGPLALITAVPTILINVLYLPFWSMLASVFDRMLTFWTTLDFTRYRTDPEGVQLDLQAAMQPLQDLTIDTTVVAGLIVPISIVAVAAITEGTLAAAAGRRPTLAGTYGAALRRRAVIIPALVLGIGYVVVFLPIAFVQPGYADMGIEPGRAGLSVLFGILALVLEIAIFYLLVRWAFYFQVVLADDVGIREGMARSARLTAGIRIRIALIVIVLTIVIGIAVSIIVAIPVVVIGLAARSIAAALLSALLVFALLAFVYIPLFVAVVTYLFDRRRGSGDPEAAS